MLVFDHGPQLRFLAVPLRRPDPACAIVAASVAIVVTATYGPACASDGPYVSVIAVHSPSDSWYWVTAAGVRDGAASP